jgi:NAD(P)H-hydrate repair Nnr-like enzyme with NAD(P)H-hydrate dehydratase domain
MDVQGSDLSHVICEPSAATVIKTYSPDLMVHSYLSLSSDPEGYAHHQKEFDQLMDRLHVLVIGPGLGRDPEMQEWAEWTLKTAIKKNIHLVLDADALWLLQNKPSADAISSQSADHRKLNPITDFSHHVVTSCAGIPMPSLRQIT